MTTTCAHCDTTYDLTAQPSCEAEMLHSQAPVRSVSARCPECGEWNSVENGS